MVACPQAPSLRGDLSSQPSCLPPFFFYGRVIIIYSSSIGTRNIAHATLCIRSQIENVCGRRNCYNVSCTAQPVVDCVYSRMLNRVCTYIHQGIWTMLILEYVVDEMKNLRSFWKLWIPLCIRYYVRLNIYIISSQYAWIQKFLTSLSRFNNFFLMVRITSYNICKKKLENVTNYILVLKIIYFQ